MVVAEDGEARGDIAALDEEGAADSSVDEDEPPSLTFLRSTSMSRPARERMRQWSPELCQI
jgi:hypothetical protein